MNKDVQIRFRVDQEMEKFIEIEEQKYRNRSEFFRTQLERISPIGRQKEVMLELEKTRMEIHKIGVNINQITKNNNSELYSDCDKKNLEANLKKIIDLEKQLVKKMDEL